MLTCSSFLRTISPGCQVGAMSPIRRPHFVKYWESMRWSFQGTTLLSLMLIWTNGALRCRQLTSGPSIVDIQTNKRVHCDWYVSCRYRRCNVHSNFSSISHSCVLAPKWEMCDTCAHCLIGPFFAKKMFSLLHCTMPWSSHCTFLGFAALRILKIHWFAFETSSSFSFN